jgi:hypothetical protein
MTVADQDTIRQRNNRANHKAGLTFVAGRWLKKADAARIQAAMDAAERDAKGETE